MKKVCAKIVQKLLTPEQKLRRKECCVDWKTSEESDEFLERVITGNESWIYEYNIELKSQSREWKQKDSPRPKKSRNSKSKIKVMLMVSFWLPWNCAPQIRIWGSNCQRSFLRGGFEMYERSCASHATGIVGGEAMDSPPWQCPRTLCINCAWVFGAQFHHRARTSPLLFRFSPLRFFLVP